jgi:two-component system response regulator
MVNEKILVVEDEELIGQDIKILLEDLGYEVPALVPSGEEAISRAGETHADLVLMDIMLEGEMDGIEAANKINNQFGIPIIYLTAYRNEEILERAKLTEPYAYIIKPFEERELRTNVEIALNRHKAEQEKIKLTEVTAKNEFLRKSLKEQETLLREIHHRVNNNMQIISSLLSLQSTQVKDERDLHLFIDSQNRVKSMAKVHERLYQSKDLSSIKFAEYGMSLLNDLFSSHRASPLIRLRADIEDVSFNMETAIPCGLIINELVSNSLKYAFPHGEGEIYVSLMHYEGNKYLLTINDNGIGLPAEIDFKNTQSLGFRLVNNLTNQLEGEIELDRTNGTTFKIIFEELKYETRLGVKETILTIHKSKELREHAEEIISNKFINQEEIPKGFRELISDLQMHQIEIEMQKEELKQFEQEIRDSRKRYFDLYNSAPLGYFTLLENGIIIEANNTGASILGISRSGLINSSFNSFLSQDSRQLFNQHNQKAIETSEKQKYELELIKAEGYTIKAYIETTPIYDEKFQFKEFQTYILDPKRFKQD